jgi:hypothetical protein
MSFVTDQYKKLQYLLKRHPFFHFFRCLLIVRKPSHKIFTDECINHYNSKASIPASFLKENANIDLSGKGSFQKAIAIASYMRATYAGGRGLGYPSAETLQITKDNMGGVCSDFSQLMINFCILNNIPVREWGVSERIYGSFGHVFNEVYCDQLNKWVLIDAGKFLYFVHQQTKQPLSTIEYIDLLTAGNGDLVVPINIFTGLEDMAIKENTLVYKTYFNKNHVFFLVSNYNIRLFDKALRFHNTFPLPMLHFALISIGAYYKYHFYINEHNAAGTRAQLAAIGRKSYGSSFLAKKPSLQKGQELFKPLMLLFVQYIVDVL